MEFTHRFFEPPDRSFFLFGPRGTGKSTWLAHRFPDALLVDLLRPDVARRLAARPERLVEMVRGSPDRAPVVIDEVQRVPELLNVVHLLLEEDPARRFVLTGSSARKLRRGGVNLLAGRALLRSLHPFMAGELPEFGLEDALRVGLLPLARAATEPADVLAAYASLYLDEEVRAEGWVRRVGDFARFLEAISFSHAGVLNVANVARECQVQRRTAQGYIEVLEDLLLAYRLPVFTRRARRRTVGHPKLYLFDAGVFRSIRPAGPLDRASEIEGAALEGLVAQHLRAWCDYSPGEWELTYWRTRSGSEVDFVLYGPDGFWALEVKNSDAIRASDLRALRTFAGDYPECVPVLLYRGMERLEIGGIRCLPVEPFLRSLSPGSPLTHP